MNRHDTSLAVRMVHYAAGNSPASIGERLREEWLADLTELTGWIARLRFAVGCIWAANTIRHDQRRSDDARGGMPIAVGVHEGMAARIHRTPGRHAPPIADSKGGATAMSDINITPLIDVMLVLLVTLIITLPMMTHAVKIELPSQRAPVISHPPEIINLDIDYDGSVAWNGTNVTGLEQLEVYFRNAALRLPQPQIRLRPDSHVKYDVVAKVLAAAQRNQLANIGFASTAAFEE